MTEPNLKEMIFDLVTSPPCSKCEFWDMDGHSCFSRAVHKTTRCKLLDQILALVKEAGYKSPEEVER